MKILFMGTDTFAVPSLKALAQKHEITAVVTRPDKPRGRGKKLSPTPVKEAAIEMGIPVYDPKGIKGEKFRKTMAGLDFDIVVLVAYGRVLPEDFLEKPTEGCICLHPSKLPEYRGCSPIESAILDGKDETGISVFYIEKEIDTGDVIYQEDVNINPEDTGGSLRDRLSFESPEVLLKALDLIEKKKVTPVIQDSDKSSYAPKLEREDGLINWNDPAQKIHNQIRALNPKPGAYTYYQGKILKVLKSEITEETPEKEAGVIYDVEKKKGLKVACGDRGLLLLEVQPQGKNAMDAWSYVMGYRPEIGGKLGDKPE